jgi:hypothetical protein
VSGKGIVATLIFVALCMVVSIAIGVAFGTAIQLAVIPAFMLVGVFVGWLLAEVGW